MICNVFARHYPNPWIVFRGWHIPHFFYILALDESIFSSFKFRLMKKITQTHPQHHHHHLGQTATTVLLAIAFLSVVMLLSYLFSAGLLTK